MATIAQGQLAGVLADGLIDVQAFSSALQSAITAGQSVYSIALGVSGGVNQITFSAPLNQADSAVLMNDLIALAAKLTQSWTAQLTAL